MPKGATSTCSIDSAMAMVTGCQSSEKNSLRSNPPSSWQPLSIRSEASASDSDSGALDLFRFSDSPIFESLNLARTTVTAHTTEGPVR